MEKMMNFDDEKAKGEFSNNSSASTTPKMQKKIEGLISSKRNLWKNWGWKQSPAKSSSIEEETSSMLESPKKSPKHEYRTSSNEIINTAVDLQTPLLRRQHKQQNSKEVRSSADARLIQIINPTDAIDKFDSECDEFQSLLSENGRPASIHTIQAYSQPKEF